MLTAVPFFSIFADALHHFPVVAKLPGLYPVIWHALASRESFCTVTEKRQLKNNIKKH